MTLWLPVAALGVAPTRLLRAVTPATIGTLTAFRASISVMATPEPAQEILDRLTRAEDAVQRFEFIHLVKTDAQTAGLGILYAQQKRMQEEVAGFRAETAAHLGVVDTRLSAIESALAEVLRRLPEV